MKEQNNIEKIFKEGFKGFEASPGTNAWANVQAGIGSGAAGSTAAASGASSWVATAVVGVIISAIAVGGYFFFNQEGEKQKQEVQAEESKIEQTLEVESQQEITSTPNEEAVEETLEPPVPTEDPVKSTSIILDEKDAEVTKSTDDIAVETETNEIDEVESVESSIDDLISGTTTSGNDLNSVEKASPTVNSSTGNKVDNAVINTSETQKNADDHLSPQANTRIDSGKVDPRPHVVFPNTFSPGGDGINDKFNFNLAKSDEIENIVIDIINREGKIVDQIRGVNDSWNGTLPDGSMAPKGLYIYSGYVVKNGKQYAVKGSLTVN